LMHNHFSSGPLTLPIKPSSASCWKLQQVAIRFAEIH
jgi:hypothetical protein